MGRRDRDDASQLEELQRRCKLLQIELEEQSRLYTQSLEVIEELEAQQRRSDEQAKALANANVRAALLMEELETREQALAEQTAKTEALLVEVAEKNAQLDAANRRLAESYDELTKEQALREIELRRLEVELQTAQTVQQLLIPAAPPKGIPGLELAMSYAPAAETGGDWLGFIHIPERRELEILIGDVTGHGVGPALIVAGAYSAFSTIDSMRRIISDVEEEQSSLGDKLRELILEQIADPCSVLDVLNDVIRSMGKQKILMTFFASNYNYDTRILRFANAGHCLPILIGEREIRSAPRSARRVPVRALVARGNPLGMPEPAGWQVRSQQLEPGDLLVYYTDGLIENRNRAVRCAPSCRLGVRDVAPAGRHHSR